MARALSSHVSGAHTGGGAQASLIPPLETHRSGVQGEHAGGSLGNLGMLISALCYGAYTVQLRREVPSEKAAPLPFLFGLMGLTVLLLSPFMLGVLHLAGVEQFSLPSPSALGVVLGNALLGTVAANLLLARATILTSPLVVVVGLSLSIPLAVASDVVRERTELTRNLLMGGIAVWVAFLGVSVSAGNSDGGIISKACAHCPWQCRRLAGLE